jgi:hypothetical protein
MTRKTDQTPEDAAALKAIADATERGEDPFDDDEPIVRESDMPAADADAGPGDEADDADDLLTDPDDDTKAAGPAELDEAAKEEPSAEALEKLANPTKPQQPEKFRSDLPTDFKEQRTKLMGEKSAAMKKLMDGEIDADAYAAEDMRITDAMDDLNAMRIRAETLQEVNTQTSTQYQARAINDLIRRTKAEVDYKGDPDAPKQFDMALGMLQADPSNADSDFVDLADKAHRMVAAMRGLTLKAVAAPAPASTAPARKPGEKAPVTLRSLPAAAGNATGGGVIEQMSRLHGPSYEAAFAKLTPAQRASLLDEEV